jgi:hypothetical protein
MEGFKKMGKMQSDMPCYKKGGVVKKADGGGMINPVVNMAVKRAMKKAPKPAMAGKASQGMPAPAKASARAMPAMAKPNAPAVGAPQGMPRPVGRGRPSTPAMGALKKGGKADMSKLDKEIRNESEEIGRVKARLNKHEGMEASKAHKGLKTGGVANAQGGYKTGGVARGNAGGYKTGGVANSNAGGYKAGGKATESKYKYGGKC